MSSLQLLVGGRCWLCRQYPFGCVAAYAGARLLFWIATGALLSHVLGHWCLGLLVTVLAWRAGHLVFGAGLGTVLEGEVGCEWVAAARTVLWDADAVWVVGDRLAVDLAVVGEV